MSRARPLIILVLSLLAISAAACGGDDDDGTGGQTPAEGGTSAAATTPAGNGDGPADGSADAATDTPAPLPVGQVLIQGFAFDPAEIEIVAGESVKWTLGNDGVTHTVTADDGTFDSGEMTEEGQAFQVAFQDPGTYTYHCEIHRSMTGTITVAAS